jgi:hypothetical protein
MKISLHAAMTDDRLFGRVFAAPSFWTWKTVAKLVSGVPLTEDREVELFKSCTGRTRVPDTPVTRLYLLVGRRGGKDRFMSAVAVWTAALANDWRKVLSAGETGTVVLIGADRRQGNILRRYCLGLTDTPLIRTELARDTQSDLEFHNSSELSIVTNDARLVRGRSALAVLGTEACHWRVDDDSPSNDAEVLAAAMPSLSMTPGGGILILASSPHRKSGVMFDRWRALWGNDDAEALCWVAPSTTMNPLLPVDIVEAALEDDPAKNRSEYLACWREDLSDFVPSDCVDACTEWTVRERPYDGRNKYVAFTDAAGGTGSDAFGLVIAHRDKDNRAVVDVIRERKPRFIPALVVQEYSELLHAYGIREVVGDRFSGGWCASEFERCRIKYKPSDKNKSELYLACLPMLLAGNAVLLDDERLRRQFGELERRAHAGNRESVDHRSGRNDDVANSVAGAIVLTAAKLPQVVVGCQDGSALYPDEKGKFTRRVWPGKPPRARDTIRFVRVNERGEEITAEQALALRHTPPH